MSCRAAFPIIKTSTERKPNPPRALRKGSYDAAAGRNPSGDKLYMSTETALASSKAFIEIEWDNSKVCDKNASEFFGFDIPSTMYKSILTDEVASSLVAISLAGNKRKAAQYLVPSSPPDFNDLESGGSGCGCRTYDHEDLSKSSITSDAVNRRSAKVSGATSWMSKDEKTLVNNHKKGLGPASIFVKEVQVFAEIIKDIYAAELVQGESLPPSP